MFQASEMLQYLRKAFEDTIINSEWLDTGTKMAALNKLQYIRQSISFENWMLTPSELEEGYRSVSTCTQFGNIFQSKIQLH